jgi:NodT family efflux transporter outer membrane factor (OMF) lipoprotein
MPSRLLVALLAATLVSACSLAPEYRVPAVPVADAYQGAGPWSPAQPGQALPHDGWWRVYQDAQLDTLQQRLLVNNADLAAALAHYQQAQAFVDAASADLYPQLSATGNPQRDRQSATRPLRGNPSPNDYNSVTLGAQVSYEVDLWGRVRDNVAASRDEAAATGADLASVQLSLQAQLADTYWQLRGFDQENALLEQTIAAFARALQLTQSLHDGGIVSQLDVARARTQLSSARSLLSQTRAQRALSEHAIAVLVGASASQFSIAAQTGAYSLPPIPLGVPSTLLQRRPDIAAAERRTAEANAKIGVARAAYFPALTLSAQGGVQSAAYAGLLTAPNIFWAAGPLLAGYIFDGGRRAAGVASARAAEDEAGARYRGVVLNAFREVEDNLSLLGDLGHALNDQEDAAAAAQQALDLALNQYRHGAVAYLDVVQAQTAQLDAQRSVLDLQTRQLRANVALVRALGGGWTAPAGSQPDAAAPAQVAAR